jgi:hypothetical protein
LVVELVLLYPMRRAPYVGHRVDGLTGPLKAGDLLPFRLPRFYNRRMGISTATFFQPEEYFPPPSDILIVRR